MKLWGRDYSRRDLESYTGDLRQIADIRLATLDDGMERGTRVALVRTGSGFDFTVLLDRAMDIGTATYNGIPLAWESGTGAAHPGYYEDGPRGWHRTFHGGLLCLCGLTNAGRADPAIDPENGETLLTHGRISNTPAYDIRIERLWSDDGQRWTLRLSGVVDEVSLGGWRLRLERTLDLVPGEAAVRIRDQVRNMGGQPAPLMILYHCNFGWPLISPDSEIASTAAEITAYDAASQVSTWNHLQAPTPNFPQQIFVHDFADSSTPQHVSVRNRALDLGVELRFDATTLPYLTQWKKLDFGDYLVGLEPGNCLPEGRVAARETGRLEHLPPGETRQFAIEFVVNPLFNAPLQ